MASIIPIIREDIGDLLPASSGQLYSDSSLVTLIGRCLIHINGLLATSLTVSASGEIGPSGVPNQQVDAAILCTECLIAKRELNISARDSIKAKQDENSIDTSVALNARRDLMKDICGQAERALATLQRDLAGASSDGQIIWMGNTRLFEDVDFDGTGFDTLFDVNNDITFNRDDWLHGQL
jgi:hypothetical protein